MKSSAEDMPDLRPISEIKLCVVRSRSPDLRGFMSKLIDAEVQRHNDQSDDAAEVAPKDITVRLWGYYQKNCKP